MGGFVETPKLQIKEDLFITDNKLIPPNGTSRGWGKNNFIPLSIIIF